MFRLLPLIVSIAVLPLSAQTLTGSIADTASMPIPYVNIGLTNRPVGTVSDREGTFSLSLGERTAHDTLRISSIGYEPQQFAVADVDTRQPLHVTLHEAAIRISDIVVSAKPRKLRTYGRSVRSRAVSTGVYPGQEGGELGIRCNLGRRSGVLQRLRIDLCESRGIDTLRFRINVYPIRGNRIAQEPLPIPVYYSLPAELASRTHSIDLAPHAIRVEGDFLIAIENLTPMSERAQFWLRARLLARTFSRYTSQSPWESIPAGVGMSVDVLTD